MKILTFEVTNYWMDNLLWVKKWKKREKNKVKSEDWWRTKRKKLQSLNLEVWSLGLIFFFLFFFLQFLFLYNRHYFTAIIMNNHSNSFPNNTCFLFSFHFCWVLRNWTRDLSIEPFIFFYNSYRCYIYSSISK